MARTKKKRPEQQYIQYSKKIATAVTIFWFIVRLGAMVASVMRVEISDSMVALLKGADDVMMVNLGFYCGNSVAEKGIVGYFDARKSENETTNEETEGGNG